MNEGAEYDDSGVVELGGMEIQAADPRDVEKVDKSQILQLRQKLDSDVQTVTDIDQLLDRGKVTTVITSLCNKEGSGRRKQLADQNKLIEHEGAKSRRLLVEHWTQPMAADRASRPSEFTE